MKHSLSYYITLLILKLMRAKSHFSKDPIDLKLFRKNDLHTLDSGFFKKHRLEKFKVLDTHITATGTNSDADKLIIFIHGGAFISGPGLHHWQTMKEMAQQTNQIVWLCDYPKAPENQIGTISENIDATYHKALEKFKPSNICLIGDSVGGLLITALVQRLIRQHKAVPKKIILVTPVMDSSMSNPDIEKLEAKDPILAKKGVLSAKKMCSGALDLQDPMISPLYGSFEGFPPTTLLLAQRDIMYPDCKLAAAKLEKAAVQLQVIDEVGMPHIWPFLPVMKEGKQALKQIISTLKV